MLHSLVKSREGRAAQRTASRKPTRGGELVGGDARDEVCVRDREGGREGERVCERGIDREMEREGRTGVRVAMRPGFRGRGSGFRVQAPRVAFQGARSRSRGVG